MKYGRFNLGELKIKPFENFSMSCEQFVAKFRLLGGKSYGLDRAKKVVDIPCGTFKWKDGHLAQIETRSPFGVTDAIYRLNPTDKGVSIDVSGGENAIYEITRRRGGPTTKVTYFAHGDVNRKNSISEQSHIGAPSLTMGNLRIF